MDSVKSVILDLDGTLLDTGGLLLHEHVDSQAIYGL
jgi:phosphoglycolate phosphatase-like HAD superfamily hydrolase